MTTQVMTENPFDLVELIDTAAPIEDQIAGARAFIDTYTGLPNFYDFKKQLPDSKSNSLVSSIVQNPIRVLFRPHSQRHILPIKVPHLHAYNLDWDDVEEYMRREGVMIARHTSAPGGASHYMERCAPCNGSFVNKKTRVLLPQRTGEDSEISIPIYRMGHAVARHGSMNYAGMDIADTINSLLPRLQGPLE